METTSEQARYSVEMLISDWLFIDGTMDNHVHSAIDSPGEDELDEETGLPSVAELGLSIRESGWDQIHGWPRDAAGFRTWPAPGQTATMTLTRAQWGLVVFALNHWATVSESLSKPDEAAESRALAATVGQRLAEQGWSPESA